MKKSSRNLFTIISLILTTNLALNKNCFAWSGIDPKKNSLIEIETGNLVREGSIIEFFDSNDGNYHNGKILIMNSASNATELTIEDFNDKHKERFFLMND